MHLIQCPGASSINTVKFMKSNRSIGRYILEWNDLIQFFLKKTKTTITASNFVPEQKNIQNSAPNHNFPFCYNWHLGSTRNIDPFILHPISPVGTEYLETLRTCPNFSKYSIIALQLSSLPSVLIISISKAGLDSKIFTNLTIEYELHELCLSKFMINNCRQNSVISACTMQQTKELTD